MKKNILLIVTFLVFAVNSIVYASGVPADFTGENYFRAPMEDVSAPKKQPSNTESYSGTVPPFKVVRLKVREYFATKDQIAEAKAKKKAIKQAMKANSKNAPQETPEEETIAPEDLEH